MQFIIGVKIDNNIIADSKANISIRNSIGIADSRNKNKRQLYTLNGEKKRKQKCLKDYILRFCGIPQSVNLFYRVNNIWCI